LFSSMMLFLNFSHSSNSGSLYSTLRTCSITVWGKDQGWWVTPHLGIHFWIIKKSLWKLWRTVRSPVRSMKTKLITRDATDIKINILHTMNKQIYSFVTWTVGFHKSTTVWVNGDHYIRVIHTFVPKWTLLGWVTVPLEYIDFYDIYFSKWIFKHSYYPFL